MIVVCDTSPLTSLAAIGEFDLLRLLFGQVHIAEAVREELNSNGRVHPGSRETEAADWIKCHSIENLSLMTVLRRDLDKGEAATLVLALQLGAHIVLLDEREARSVADSLNLQVMGVLGVLLRAKSKGHIDLVRPRLEALRAEAGFYVSESLFLDVLGLAGE